jgi:hypothetical protein
MGTSLRQCAVSWRGVSGSGRVPASLPSFSSHGPSLFPPSGTLIPNVADPDPETVAFLTPGSGLEKFGSGIRKHPGPATLLIPHNSVSIFLNFFFHKSLKTKGHKKSQTVETKVFLAFFLMMEGSRSGSGSVQITMDPYPGDPKTYGSGSTLLISGG